MSTQTRITPERVGKMAAKVVTEAAYAVAGLADIVAGTVQDVVASGKQSAAARKASGASVRSLAGQVPGQLRNLADEVTEAYRGLAARGRTVLKDGFASTAHRSE